MTKEQIKAINDLTAETKRVTDFAVGTIERERRMWNVYIAIMAFLLGVLVGILGYTGYVAYVATDTTIEEVE